MSPVRAASYVSRRCVLRRVVIANGRNRRPADDGDGCADASQRVRVVQREWLPVVEHRPAIKEAQVVLRGGQRDADHFRGTWFDDHDRWDLRHVLAAFPRMEGSTEPSSVAMQGRAEPQTVPETVEHSIRQRKLKMTARCNLLSTGSTGRLSLTQADLWTKDFTGRFAADLHGRYLATIFSTTASATAFRYNLRPEPVLSGLWVAQP